MIGPIKGPSVHNNPANACAVSACPFGETMDDDAGPQFKGAAEIRSGECIINNQGDFVGLGNLRQLFEGRNLQSRIGNGLAKNGSRLVVNGCFDTLWIADIDKLGIDAELGQNVVELDKIRGEPITIKSMSLL